MTTSTPAPARQPPSSPGPGLGLDAGGTQTRWALADATGRVLAEGQAAPFSGLQLGSVEGDAAIAATLVGIAQAATAAVGCGPAAVLAGITGLDAAQWPQLCVLAAAALAIPATGVRAMSDIELACRAAFEPGAGIVVYAGTGSIAAFIDASGTLQRAGGHGALIDDAGGGHWIARQALRHIWRAEDEAPGAWRQSALARRVFEQIGGSDWAHTRQWVYGATRGELGTLALAVAAAADEDAAAAAILHAAGTELARLAGVMLRRVGARPLALAGRVFELHPSVENALIGALPAGTPVQRLQLPAHHAAACLAARAAAQSAAPEAAGRP